MPIFLSSGSEVLTSDHSVLLTTSTLSLLVAVFLISKIFISFSFQILISFWHFLCFLSLSMFKVKFCRQIFMMVDLNFLSDNGDLCDIIGFKSVILSHHGWKMGSPRVCVYWLKYFLTNKKRLLFYSSRWHHWGTLWALWPRCLWALLRSLRYGLNRPVGPWPVCFLFCFLAKCNQFDFAHVLHCVA